jgi:hypothetical protein
VAPAGRGEFRISPDTWHQDSSKPPLFDLSRPAVHRLAAVLTDESMIVVRFRSWYGLKTRLETPRSILGTCKICFNLIINHHGDSSGAVMACLLTF